MKKMLKTLALTSALAFSASAAYATGTGTATDPVHNGCSNGCTTQPTNPTPTNPINNQNNQGQTQGQGQGQIQGQGQTQGQGQSQTANGGTGIGTGIGVGTGISSSTSGAVSGSTSGATATTGAITNDNRSGATANGGAATTGPINVAPQQSTVNNFRSFVGTNAPNLAGSVDNCLAVLGWSAAVNFFGNTGIGVGGGNQRTEYVEQCAAVKSAFEVWNRSAGDVQKETFAIDMLIKALPTYGKPAMDAAVNRINTYIEQNGDQEPDSVMNLFGAKAFRRKPVDAAPAAATVQAAPQANPTNLTVVVQPVIEKKETTVIAANGNKKKPAPKAKPKCTCAK